MYESLIIKSILISPLALIIYLLAAMALGWTLYGLRGYRHWVKRFNRYHILPSRRQLRPNYGYVEYIPEVVRQPRSPIIPIAPVATYRAPVAPVASSYSTKDDLQVIEGIGPKIEAILNEQGIYTWRELAKTPLENLKRILERAGSQFQSHDPRSWADQAKMADQGMWNQLKEFQNIIPSTEKK